MRREACADSLQCVCKLVRPHHGESLTKSKRGKAGRDRPNPATDCLFCQMFMIKCAFLVRDKIVDVVKLLVLILMILSKYKM